MTEMIATSNRRAVIGAGITGRSVARFLKSREIAFDWYDTRDELQDADIDSELRLGEISDNQLVGYDELIVSPGIAKSESYLSAAEAAGSKIVGDIEIFARQVEASVAAITGSNGKTTVTSLLAEVAKACGVNAVAAGNLGEPVLDQLDRNYDLFVLELSSFQLETTQSLKPDVAVILNISPDHMDRYTSMIDYHAAKQRIHTGAVTVISNRDDLLTQPMLADSQRHKSFGIDQPDLGHYGIRIKEGKQYVACGLDVLFPLSQMKLKGSHNLANAMAVLAIADTLGLDRDTTIAVICQFAGLPHRCELVSTHKGVQWINDSKATNTGAAIAAIDSNSGEGNLILIAGGQTKDQDFQSFGKLASQKVKHFILMGEGAAVLTDAIDSSANIYQVENMQQAVNRAQEIAKFGDSVLLSPACASFDQFESYQDRGNQFRKCVEAMQ